MTPIYRRLGNSNYLVSCFGTIRTADTFKLIKPFKHYKGYLRVGLSINKKRKNFSVHRLVAKLWVRKPHRKDHNIVNHLDGNKLNNHWTNFEWTTISGNTKHAVELGLIDMDYVRNCRKNGKI